MARTFFLVLDGQSGGGFQRFRQYGFVHAGAAFSISHVALAMAISSLSGQMNHAGQIVMLIVGNALILVLEGSIVAIQALRLEYYEGFSRYFTCFGREFKPLLDARANKPLV
jgi:V/A-type H+-transporting ATPase subunit I